MAHLTPTSREQLDAAARVLEEMAARIRAAAPDNVRLLDWNRETTYVVNSDLVTADICTVRVEWLTPVASGD